MHMSKRQATQRFLSSSDVALTAWRLLPVCNHFGRRHEQSAPHLAKISTRDQGDSDKGFLEGERLGAALLLTLEMWTLLAEFCPEIQISM